VAGETVSGSGGVDRLAGTFTLLAGGEAVTRLSC
jgi:hypothetical protein